jgi:hypothetical protein
VRTLAAAEIVDRHPAAEPVDLAQHGRRAGHVLLDRRLGHLHHERTPANMVESP